MTLIYWNKQNICHIQLLLLPFTFESSPSCAMYVGNNRKDKRTVLEVKKNQTKSLTTDAIANSSCQERKFHAR